MWWKRAAMGWGSLKPKAVAFDINQTASETFDVDCPFPLLSLLSPSSLSLPPSHYFSYMDTELPLVATWGPYGHGGVCHWWVQQGREDDMPNHNIMFHVRSWSSSSHPDLCVSNGVSAWQMFDLLSHSLLQVYSHIIEFLVDLRLTSFASKHRSLEICHFPTETWNAVGLIFLAMQCDPHPIRATRTTNPMWEINFRFFFLFAFLLR